jgi:crotonobetainyl-CoA:carnitine CoA-transferase CaiB-like acyl-CoA transferase
MSEARQDQALEDLTVIDLSEGVAGAYCGKLLADYGADVIKVERPRVGDPARRHGPFPDGEPDPERSALFLYLNTNKRGVTLDIAHPRGGDVLRRMVEDADVLIEGFRPGHLAGLGLGYEALREINPDLVMTSITAFGQDGPYAELHYNNLVALALSGQLGMTGRPDREPLKPAGYQAEYQGGLHAFGATLTAVFGARIAEAGQHVDISTVEVMASVLEAALPYYAYWGKDTGRRRGNIQSSMIGIYPCADGYLGVHAMARNWAALLRLMEREDLASDPRFAEMRDRVKHNDELEAIIYAWAADQEKREVYRRAVNLRAPVAYVHTLEDLLESPQLTERDYFQEVEHPVAGRLTYPGPPFRMSETPWRPGRAPLLGEHNDEVYLGDLALPPEEYRELRDLGVI